MATSTATLQLRLAYRLGENSAPNDNNEKARRLQYLNEGKREVWKKGLFWFMQGSRSLTSTQGIEIYVKPSDVRDIVELRINRIPCQFSPQAEQSNRYQSPSESYSDSSLPKWSLFGTDELHIQPAPSVTPTVLSVTSISRSGTTATVTTLTSHGLKPGDFVAISGADQTDYNGDVRVLTTPSLATFTYAVSNAPATPATGTISAQWRNIVFRSWLLPSELTENSTDCGIPDLYSGCLDAYAYARYMQKKGKRGSAADGFDEFNEIITDMKREQNRLLMYGKNVQPLSINYVND